MNKITPSHLTKHKKHLYIVLCLLVFFIPKSRATVFYINDNSTVGDIYTTVVGNDANDGIAASSPKLTISAVYEKAKDGDTIIIDTGIYNELSDKGEIVFSVAKKITFIIAGVSDPIFSKTPLPTAMKVNPTEIYIDKDKPIDREAYLQKLRNRQIKSSNKK